jgi:hypothetical protein
MTRHKRIGIALPFDYSQSTTTDALWDRPKKAPSLTVSKLAEKLVASGVPEKVDEVVAAFAEREKAAESAKIEKLRQHIRTFPLPPPEVQKALHLRTNDPGLQKFYSLVEETGKKVGKE